MSDAADLWGAIRDEDRRERHENLERNRKRLRWMEAKGIVHVRRLSPYHVRVWVAGKRGSAVGHAADFWPSTERVRRLRATTQGWPALMEALGLEDPFAGAHDAS